MCLCLSVFIWNMKIFHSTTDANHGNTTVLKYISRDNDAYMFLQHAPP